MMNTIILSNIQESENIIQNKFRNDDINMQYFEMHCDAPLATRPFKY